MRIPSRPRDGHVSGVASLPPLVVILALLPSTAHAYIDPGYGALFIQVVASGLLGALFVFRKALRRTLAFLARALGLKRPAPQQAAPPDRDAHPKE